MRGGKVTRFEPTRWDAAIEDPAGRVVALEGELTIIAELVEVFG
jgi:hypothetical protein